MNANTGDEGESSENNESSNKQHPETQPISDPNSGSSDPTDHRKQYEWKTHYPPDAIKEIYQETFYLSAILVISFSLILLNWIGVFDRFSPEAYTTLRKYIFYSSSGLLGGIIFGLKYFYRVVARGYWHQDRKIWRLMSPFIAMTVAFVVGAMIDSGTINTVKPITTPSVVSIGFIAGYFADEAVGKMYDIASVIFGKSSDKSSMKKSVDGE